MKVTPMDIQNQKFKLGFRGYDRPEVDGFLELVSRDMEDVIRENSYLKDELEKAHLELDRLKDMEEVLKNTIISAQKMSEDFKDNAKTEAANILAEARAQAEKIVFEAEKKVAELNAEVTKMSMRLHEIKEVVKGILTGFMDSLTRAIKHGE